MDQLRVPPQSVEAEQAVLGGLMLDPNAYDRIADQLTDNDFYRRDHQLIFRAIAELAQKSKPFDAVTLGEWFESMGLAEQVAGGAYLIELASTTPSAANIVAYAEIVRDKAVLRQLIDVGTGIVNDGFQPDGRDSDMILEEAEKQVLAIAQSRTSGRSDFVDVQKALVEAFDVLQTRYANGGSVTGLPTGYTEFDELTAGLQKTDLIILAARPAMGKCLSADAEIVLEDGSVATIESIVAARDGRVATLDDALRLQQAEVSDFIDDGHKPTFEVVTRLGRRVVTTAPHPFLTLDGWKPLHTLNVGDHVAVPRQLPMFGDQPMRDCEVVLLAYLIGDGGLTGSSPRFTNTNPQIVDDFLAAVGDFGGMEAGMVERRPGAASSWRLVTHAVDLQANRAVFGQTLSQALTADGRPARQVAAAVGVAPSSITHWVQGKSMPGAQTLQRLAKEIRIEPSALVPAGHAASSRNAPSPMTAWLRELGLMGCGSHDKFVPAPVFRMPKTQVATFLNRLFATDGWATVLASGQAQLGYASVSERLARQVQHLLLRFGVVAKLRHRWVKYRQSRRVSWQLDITDADSIRTFAAEIGITGKSEALAAAVAALGERRRHSNVDHVPAAVWERIAQAKGDMSWAELARRTGYSDSNSHVGKRAIPRERLARISMVLDDPYLADLAGSDVLWDRIESITPLGEQQVYDLTIAGTHNFIANDVCVHNTTLALNMAEFAAFKSKLPVAVFSMEMSASQLALRLISSVGRVNAQRLRTGQLEDEDWSRVTSAIRQLKEVKIFIDDEPGLSPVKLAAKARRLKREHGLGLIVIDYLQLMSVPGNSENRATEISEISRSLKGLAKELQVPVIALSQLNRSLETRADKRPVMADLRESGAIEQDADMIVFIYRDDYYNKENSPDKGLAEVIIGKQRSGPTGSIKLKFFGEYTRFDNLSHDSIGSFE
ncbi:replicative DNA helicase [Aerolutibacter ruishenii]|nr:replicative DNA helicase [Lysobacter ruishenii]